MHLPALLLLAAAEAGAALPINIEAGRFEMLLAERKATYVGNVIAVQGDYEIQADRLIVHFNEDNQVTSMIATGDPAKLSDHSAAPPITVTGASLDYQFDAAAVRATGGATLFQGEDRMTAERISYDLDADRAQAFSGNGGRVRLIFRPEKN